MTPPLTADGARRFAQHWLRAWRGNDPGLWASFHSEDTRHLDPDVPEGLQGKAALLAYFRKLLAHNMHWVRSQLEGIPMDSRFLDKWLARIPVGSETVEAVGVCFVQLDDAGGIARNEVYSTARGYWHRLTNGSSARECAAYP